MVLSNDSSVQQRLQTKETSGFVAVTGQCQDKQWCPLTQKKEICKEKDLQNRLSAFLYWIFLSTVLGAKTPMDYLCAVLLLCHCKWWQHTHGADLKSVQILKPGFVCWGLLSVCKTPSSASSASLVLMLFLSWVMFIPCLEREEYPLWNDPV